jgi:hypothetical protein
MSSMMCGLHWIGWNRLGCRCFRIMAWCMTEWRGRVHGGQFNRAAILSSNACCRMYGTARCSQEAFLSLLHCLPSCSPARLLQSDAEFAEVFARSKWRQSKWGSRRIESVRG